jgi:hypothetical protein
MATTKNQMELREELYYQMREVMKLGLWVDDPDQYSALASLTCCRYGNDQDDGRAKLRRAASARVWKVSYRG